MTRHLRVVAPGGKSAEPEPPRPIPRISVDAELVDVLINVLDLLLASRTQDLAPGAKGCPPDGHSGKKPTTPTKNPRRKS